MDIQKYQGAANFPGSSSKQCSFDELMKSHHKTTTTYPVTLNPLFCFGCKRTFSDRVSLEEHACTNVSYICSCGMVFSQYLEMKGHELEHGDGDLSRLVLNWKPMRQLKPDKVLKTFDSFVKTKLVNLPSRANPTTKHVNMIMASPTINPTLNAASLEPVRPRGATVNLRRRFLPVVRVRSRQAFERGKKFRCGACRLSFHRMDQLVEHHQFHTKVGVYGCLRCGLLLVSQVSLPTHHQCGTFFATPKTRYTVGKVLPWKLVQQEGKTFFRCPWCPVAYQQEIQLRKHEMLCRFGKYRTVNGLWEKKMLRCGVCQGDFTSAKTLQEHRCPGNPDWVPGKAIVNKARNNTGVPKDTRERANQYLVPQRHQEEEVTFRFLSSRNLKTYTQQPPDNGANHRIIGEPLRLKGLEMTPISKPVIVEKGEVEIDEDCYVVESASTKASQPRP
ncbi:hypothetical protein SKAU_G00417290 [Synaphobranchus kaupii]|uniref:C2H2-type domain-containing protein n=1 Tax=Synaphobranchus kaupii TaxID=118154 RepID=A0A9Q1I8W9_SYNKA|nr:hypothetical protein SKAU_G00417290 [Synaphobranchus kaupii]